MSRARPEIQEALHAAHQAFDAEVQTWMPKAKFKRCYVVRADAGPVERFQTPSAAEVRAQALLAREDVRAVFIGIEIEKGK
jgi:hypothetical protein